MGRKSQLGHLRIKTIPPQVKAEKTCRQSIFDMRMRSPQRSSVLPRLPRPPSFWFLIPYFLSIDEVNNMVVVTAFALAFPSIIIVSALTLNNPSLMLPNSTLANITSSNYIHTCDGSFYGYDLNPMSCIEALTQIDASSTTQQTYGPRLAGRFDVKLPKRYISCSVCPS